LLLHRFLSRARWNCWQINRLIKSPR
jgi:hypothetical protein